MKALYLYGKEDLRMQEIPRPQPGPDDILLRIICCGVCGSDARAYFSGPSARYPHPVILGHEFCGEIVEAGAHVKDYAVGERVTIAPLIPCMHCPACRRGQENLCPEARVIGVSTHGAMLEYLLVPGQMIAAGGVVKVPGQISSQVAALSELVGVCLHGLQQAGLQAGEKVLIIGDGPVGLTFVQLARLLGAAWVGVSGHRPHRRQLALQLGAAVAHDSTAIDLAAEYSSAIDRVIIAASHLEAAQQALKIARPGGSVLLFSGYKGQASLELNLNDIHYRQLTLCGSVDSTINDFRQGVDLLGRLNMDVLISGAFPLQRAEEAFLATRRPDAVKMLIGEGPAPFSAK
jgi:L-iditol 2-dehydrogenase